MKRERKGGEGGGAGLPSVLGVPVPNGAAAGTTKQLQVGGVHRQGTRGRHAASHPNERCSRDIAQPRTGCAGSWQQ